MATGNSFKRRRYLVNRHYQMAFMVRLFWVVLAVTAVSSVVCSLLLWRTMSFPGQGLHVALLTSALIAVATLLFVELLLAVPIIFVLGLRQSHRVIGPVDRLKRVIDDIGKGDFTQRITLRDSDDLDGLAKAINQMAEQLQRRFSRSSS